MTVDCTPHRLGGRHCSTVTRAHRHVEGRRCLMTVTRDPCRANVTYVPGHVQGMQFSPVTCAPRHVEWKCATY